MFVEPGLYRTKKMLTLRKTQTIFGDARIHKLQKKTCLLTYVFVDHTSQPKSETSIILGGRLVDYKVTA